MSEAVVEKDGSPSAPLNKVEERSLTDWVTELGGTGAIKLKIYREDPKTFKGRNVSGHLATLDGELIDEDGARDRWGGGKFRFQAFRVNQQGKWVHAAQRTVLIAGNPKITGDLFEEGSESAVTPIETKAEETSLSRQALAMTADMAKDERRRAEKLEDEVRSANKFDPTFFNMLLAPLQTQMLELQKQLAVKDEKLTELVTKKPDSTVQDRIFEKMVDGESVRIDAIRTQHDSELRQMRASSQDDLKRMQDHYMVESQSKERSHTREIDSLKQAYQGQLDGLKLAYEARIDGLQAQIRSLERDLDSTKKELAELRVKKEVPIEEQMSRIVALKEAFEGLSGNEPEGVVEQILQKVSPLVEGIGARIADGPNGAQMRQQQAAMAQRQAMAQAAQQAPTQQRVLQLPMTVAEFQQAVEFINAAIRNDTAPEAFASSVRGARPDLVAVIREHGVDKLLAAMRVEEGTPLSTQAGRQWMRKVGKLLIEEAP